MINKIDMLIDNIDQYGDTVWGCGKGLKIMNIPFYLGVAIRDIQKQMKKFT